MNRAHAAESAFHNYDFGDRVEIEEDVDKDRQEGFVPPDIADQFEAESREWQYSDLSNKWVRPVYLLTDGGGDVLFWIRLEFTVWFYRSSDEVRDVYALESDGYLWGRNRKEKRGYFQEKDESLVKGPWVWRHIKDDEDKMLAMVLETTARPLNDPVIMQVLIGDRTFTMGETAAALELIRLAPEMLNLLASMVLRSKKAPDRLAECVDDARRILDDLALHHCRVNFRVPGYWSAEDD